MHIPSTFNARRLCHMAGQVFWVRAMSLAGWADVLAWLDDVLPGRSGREAPPRLSGAESQEALASDDGRALLCWIALRDQDVAYETARELWMNADEIERYRVLDVLMDRRRTMTTAGPTPDGDDSRSDLGSVWCGEGLASLAVEIGMEALGGLSIDQLEWLQSGGKCDAHADPDVRALAEAQRAWLAAQREREGPGEGPEPRPVRDAIDPGAADRRQAAMLAALKAEVAKRDAGLPYSMPSLTEIDEEAI